MKWNNDNHIEKNEQKRDRSSYGHQSSEKQNKKNNYEDFESDLSDC